MPRLFVAVDLPYDMWEALAAVQPPASAGVRRVALDQMHVSLHFSGVVDTGRIANALSIRSQPAFALSIQGVGQFRSADGAVTLWAGFAESDGLRRLHASVGAALLVEGFRPESRPYAPHVTVARCDPTLA